MASTAPFMVLSIMFMIARPIMHHLLYNVRLGCCMNMHGMIVALLCQGGFDALSISQALISTTINGLRPGVPNANSSYDVLIYHVEECLETGLQIRLDCSSSETCLPVSYLHARRHFVCVILTCLDKTTWMNSRSIMI